MKKMTGDIFLNVFSLGISTAILQLAVYPIISFKLPTGEFGMLLTIMGVINIIAVVFGGSLNNTQLIDKKLYTDNYKYYGDFKRILYCYLIFIFFSSCFILVLPFFRLNYVSIFLLVVLIILTTLRSYLPVLWRITLSYDKVLKHSIITAVGYIIGILIFLSTNSIQWPVVFLIGEIFSTCYLFRKTNFLSFKITKSSNYIKVNQDYLNLFSANIVANILTYFDRFILQGLLGSDEVSIFFAASIFGKLSSLMLQPIAGVVLSYLSREDDGRKKRYFSIFTIMSLVSGIVLFGISIIFSPILVKILYPILYIDAVKIMNLSNLSSIILIVGSLFQPIILKFSKLYWQNVIQLFYAISFVLLGFYLTDRFQLIGFVYASLVSNIVRLLGFVLVGYFSIWREKND